MTTRIRLAIGVAVAATVVSLGWLLFVGLPRWYGSATVAHPPASGDVAPGEPAPTIKATLFFVSEDGLRLVGVESDVTLGATPAEQGRHILEKLLEPAPAPLASAVPPGTILRTMYVTSRGDAFVDLSGTVVTAHSGGSLDELFTVYAIVNTLTVNLPALHAVQILVDGQEVDTLAGHVDLRQPLRNNLTWVTLEQPSDATPQEP